MKSTDSLIDVVGCESSVFRLISRQEKSIKAAEFILIISFVLASVLLIASPTKAEGLGRLFTTPRERVMLERLRDPVTEVIVQAEEDPETETEEVTVIPEEPKKPLIIIPRPDIPDITVNGLVKRSGGRSTAWVNGINTNTGNLESQYIEVNHHRIGRDHVHVEVEDDRIGDVSLKVGQSLDPDAAKITDSYQIMSDKSDKE